MRLLLDTNALIWALLDDPSLTREARSAIGARGNHVAASAASVWEISIKHRAGKLRSPVDDVVRDLARRFSMLPITPEHAWAAGQLPLHHRDPFDRMLVAQAQLEGLTIVTRDPKIARYQVAILPA
ncbi:MAG TPA: type II toxin-antitoxin system VapC family toxin [Gaiellaceae bacterium]|nr:type II toxin-antitoxin system VapC family toxin [Gaiellaceae bacterium]